VGPAIVLKAQRLREGSIRLRRHAAGDAIAIRRFREPEHFGLQRIEMDASLSFFDHAPPALRGHILDHVATIIRHECVAIHQAPELRRSTVGDAGYHHASIAVANQLDIRKLLSL
jgi:hypothetical protein